MDPQVIKALGPLGGGLFQLIDDLFTTEEERAGARLKVLQLVSSEKLAQMGVNAEEAKHRSLFVAGWRPAVGWICTAALGWQFVLLPVFTALISMIAAINGVPVDFSGMLTFDIAELMPVLLGMLGLGAMRSYEKAAGVASNNLGGRQ